MRAKYLDWCSAQVADHFLALSPTEIFELAQRAAQDTEESGRPLSSGVGVDTAADLQSYRALVEQVTEVLWLQLDLPTYDEWVELYRADPSGVEEQLLGFWREES